MKPIIAKSWEEAQRYSPCEVRSVVLEAPIKDLPIFKEIDKRKAKKWLRKYKKRGINYFMKPAFEIFKLDA